MPQTTVVRSLLLSGIALLMLGLVSCAEYRQTSFFTQGNCEECAEIIRKKLVVQVGVDSAGWDFETGLTTVKFDPGLTSEDKLQEALAEAGFETQYYPANEAAQAELPLCCQEAVDRKLKRIEPTLPPAH